MLLLLLTPLLLPPLPPLPQTIMLLLGGFAIAAALSKHFIAKQLAVSILSRVGRKPHHVLLANMLVATFASMWISNVAAPVLCFSLVQPILRTLKTDHPFNKSLVMGIALASNLGGMTSPISSPQNIFAIERMSMGGQPPSWLTWFAVALPVAFIGNLVCWATILMVYQPLGKMKEVCWGRGGTVGIQSAPAELWLLNPDEDRL
jgi:di/tricarboxylate transporter